MKRLAGFRGPLATLLVGALLGYVVAAVATPFFQESPLFGGTGESKQARAYMVGVLQSDPEALVALRPARDVASRAIELQGSGGGLGQWKAKSLTYLGGGSLGRFSVHIYTVELRNATGVSRFFPLALTLVNGKVVRTQ